MTTAPSPLFDYFTQKPKNFFYAASGAAWWMTLSSSSRETALKIAQVADLAYSACTWPDLCIGVKQFIRAPTTKSLVAVGGALMSAIEFSHTYLKVVDLGKRLPYIQVVGYACDCVAAVEDLRGRCKPLSKQTRLDLWYIVEDIIMLAQAVVFTVAIAYNPALAFSFTTVMVLDTLYLVADVAIYYLNPDASSTKAT
jgi:hypothetical protein